MKLRNKKTGEIGELTYFGSKMYVLIDNELKTNLNYNSLAELNEEWEDYEELKDHYYIDYDGDIMVVEALDYEPKIKVMKQIGNYFETKEEAEKAAEKLKAWQRLKDKGFHWLWYNSTPTGNSVEFYINEWDKEATRDITLLFGGEE